MNIKFSNILTIIVLGMAGGAIYCLPYLKYVFYDQMLLNMGITDSQCGLLMTVYAIACLIVYFPGGVLADKIPAKLSIVGSLFAASALTYIFAFNPTNYAVCLAIWFGFAFGAIFLCWPAIMKTVRVLGGDNVSTAYSIYYAANGTTGGLVNWAALQVYAQNADPQQGFFWAIIVMGMCTTVIPCMVWFLLRNFKDPAPQASASDKKFNLKDIKEVLTNSKIWLLSALLFSTYTIYTAVTYYTPYLTGMFKISPELSGNLTIVRLFGFMLLAPVSGMLADRVFHSSLKWFLVALTIILVPTIALFVLGDTMSVTFVCTITLIPAFFASGLYSIMFSTLNECKIPVHVAGTAIGVVSIFTFLPDMIIHTFFGTLLDAYGVGAWDLIWKFMAVTCVVTFLVATVLIRKNKADDAREAARLAAAPADTAFAGD